MSERIFISYKRVDKECVFVIKDSIEKVTCEKCWINLDGINKDWTIREENHTHEEKKNIVVYRNIELRG